MTRATLEDRTASLVQTLRTGRPLNGGLLSHGVSELCTNSLAHGLRGGIQAHGKRPRPMQTWVSCSGCLTIACDPHAQGGAECGEQRTPDIEHSDTLGLTGHQEKHG